MEHRFSKRLLQWCCIASALLLPRPGFGDSALSVGYFGEYSNNILRSDGSPQASWANVWTAGLAYRESGPNLAANSSIQVEHRDYGRESFRQYDDNGDPIIEPISGNPVFTAYPDETLGFASIGALWTISPRRLIWTLTDRLDQLPRNAANPIGPGNRDSVNVVDTGPDLLLPLTTVDTLVLGARVGNTWFKSGEGESNHAALHLRLRHRVSQFSEFSLNAEGQKTRYTDQQDPVTTEDFTRLDSYVRYDQRHPQSRIIVDLGSTRINRLGVGEDTDGSLVRLNLAQRVTPGSSLVLSAGRELSNVSSVMLAGVVDPTLQLDPTDVTPIVITQTASTDLYVSRYTDIYYNQLGALTGIQAGIYHRRLEYLDDPLLDRTESGARIQVTYILSPTATAGAHARAVRASSYFLLAPPAPSDELAERLDRDVSYGVMWSYRVTPNLTFGVEATKTMRNSSYPPPGENGLSASYSETRGLITLTYSTNPLLTANRR